ncbi:multiple epidermal growth factor-like domains protein 10 [Saccostrea cucullata]|uniref:multiple epidermal growth factor-like domains protein 10 n=1 Tax=Saccostrea cuccullata TaxID=36930 RepID=UPI002ED3DD54
MLQVCFILTTLITAYGYVNLALNKPTWQSQQHNPGYSTFDSSNAVDGLMTDLSALGGQCSISADEYKTATWWVNLTSIRSIHDIRIYYRTGNVAWGCIKTGYYGKNCSISCSRNCKHSYCQANTGACLQCKSGFHGHQCELQCEGGRYGQDCKETCGACLGYKQCHHINGSCLEGCDAGYEGQLCKTSCSARKFGFDCQKNCNEHCKVPYKCNKGTGECEDGCQPGWEGPRCEQDHYTTDIMNMTTVTNTKEVDGWMEALEKGNDCMVRFYGILAAFCVSLTVIIVLAVYICIKRRRKQRQDRKCFKDNFKPDTGRMGLNNISAKITEDNKTYEELGQRTLPSEYEIIQKLS